MKTDKRVISTEKAPAAVGPYAQGVIANRFLFTSGQLPMNPVEGRIVAGGIRAQSEQSLLNLKAIIEEAGGTMKDFIKINVYLEDMKYFGEFNEIYSEFFSKPYPARSCVAVRSLPMDALVEIEGVAAL